ncbi:hypothetical protein EDD85DRAFT_1022808 [Armillaria nabsnona]|nr:hypothetical protein EDD85DRAFT_1022808 [Armillaria nabsnona]
MNTEDLRNLATIDLRMLLTQEPPSHSDMEIFDPRVGSTKKREPLLHYLRPFNESCHSNSFFSPPRPPAYNDPRDSHSFRRLVQSPSRPVRTGLTRRLRPLRVVALGSFAAFERPAFTIDTMERIHALPTEVSARIQ